MSKSAIIAVSTLAALTAAAVPAAAHDKIDQRQERQAKAIELGRKSGTITWLEGIKLRREQRDIAALEAAYRADGRLTKAERSALEREQDDAARNIAAERNDRWARLWFLPRVGK